MPTYESIASTSVGTATGTISFSSIPTTYRHLELRIFGKRSTAAQGDVAMRFNGDAGSNYSYLYTQTTNTTRSTALLGSTALRFGYVPEIATSTFGFLVAQIPNYRSSYSNRSVHASGGYYNTSMTTDIGIVSHHHGQWNQQSPITSIDVILASGLFAVGTIVSLYGLRSS